jgi:hypothetical protein
MLKTFYIHFKINRQSIVLCIYVYMRLNKFIIFIPSWKIKIQSEKFSAQLDFSSFFIVHARNKCQQIWRGTMNEYSLTSLIVLILLSCTKNVDVLKMRIRDLETRKILISVHSTTNAFSTIVTLERKFYTCIGRHSCRNRARTHPFIFGPSTNPVFVYRCAYSNGFAHLWK